MNPAGRIVRSDPAASRPPAYTTARALLVLLAFASMLAALGGLTPAHVGAQEGAITAGATVRVRADGDCLRVRSAPSLSGTELACVAEGSELLVVDGPVTADGYDWVLVQSSPQSGWAAASFLELVSTTPTEPPDETDPGSEPDPGSTPDPADSTTLAGTIPVAGGVGLVVWGGTTEALAAALTAQGCDFLSAWTNGTGGRFTGYLHGAPDFVNRDWVARYPDGTVPAGTPLATVCRDGGGSAPAVVLPGSATGGSLTGLPVSGGVGLAVWSGAIADLATTATQQGCTFVSAWAASTQGGLVGYLVGAPAIVNRAWQEQIGAPELPPGSPVVVVCRGASSGAPTPPSTPDDDDSVDQGSGDGPALRIPVPVPPDWRSRPPGPAGNEA